jgi:hypothetical protein
MSRFWTAALSFLPTMSTLLQWHTSSIFAAPKELAMSRTEPAKGRAWQIIFAVILVAGGFGLIAWSFIWPSVSSRRSGWSQDQAREYQAASARLHSLSHQHAHAAERGNEAAVRAELDKAQANYEVLRGELESAMRRPRRIAILLRLAGLALVGAGAMILYFGPPPTRRDES